MLRRVLRQLGQQLEELLATPGLVVERDQKAVRRPHPAAAPRRKRCGLVQRGAQAVARAQNRFIGNAGLLRAQLELAHLVQQMLAQDGRRRVRRGCADLRNQVQQGVRGRHQRVGPADHVIVGPQPARG
ncbi:hypothetical protein D9M69_675570 [compost metagenome]